MFAIVDILGQQMKVEANKEYYCHRIDSEEGSKVTFDNVLLTSNGSTTTIGTPNLSGASVSATVVEHLKGDKVIVFKKKRRKGYKVKNGHRQYLSKIKIDSIAG